MNEHQTIPGYVTTRWTEQLLSMSGVEICGTTAGAWPTVSSARSRKVWLDKRLMSAFEKECKSFFQEKTLRTKILIDSMFNVNSLKGKTTMKKTF